MDTALQAAWEAGDILLARANQPRAVTVKGPRDVVTDSDFAAQHAIEQTIRRTYPDHRLVAEEGAVELELDSNTPLWLVDPLDGTTNYARGFPVYSVSIGLLKDGAPYLGVIHDPLTKRTFIGESGLGAHLLTETLQGEMQPIQASRTTSLEEALIGVDWPHDNLIREKAVTLLGRIAPQARTIRALGSAALALGYVAAGWLDGYYHLSLMPWDGAAGAAIIEAAGGWVVNPEGQPWRPGHPGLIAGAPGVVERMLELL